LAAALNLAGGGIDPHATDGERQFVRQNDLAGYS
jgi:hypothetical protein